MGGVANDEQDMTPEGEPIDVRTMWLDFGDEGQCAISMDLTRFNAAMRQVGETLERSRPRRP